MAEFIVETYVARADRAVVDSGAGRARAAAEQLTREGVPVSFLRTIFVPEDETCFYLFDADSASAVAEAGNRAELEFDHVRESLSPA